ncbi:MAG: hypothetical protein FI687_04685 [SAR202 cluster bacterium]|nr:hypothetical protein [SAR202 cluster bacterium]
MLLETIILFLFSYFMGTFPSGFLYSKIFRKTDIRKLGSGSTGAMNVYRNTDKLGFLITILADILKGSIAMFVILKLLGTHEAISAFSGILVILGHIYPVTMQFKGGKGLGPFLGIMLIVNWRVSTLGLIMIPIASTIFKNLTLGVLLMVILTPIGVFASAQKPIETVGITISAILVFFAHRNNLKEILKSKNS